MLTILPRRPSDWFQVLLLVLALGAARPACATHLLGGEMSYVYVDANGPVGRPYRYRITLTGYYNGLWPADTTIRKPPTTVDFQLYYQGTGAGISTFTSERVTDFGSPVYPRVPVGCGISGPSQPFYLLRYSATVSLPFSAAGYFAVCQQRDRNLGLTNVDNPPGANGQGATVPMTLYVSMSSPFQFNRSPIFSDTAVAVVCANDTTILLNNAVDPDGDELKYQFGTPYGTRGTTATFPPYPNPVPYFMGKGFSGTTPLGTGPGNFAVIDANTGTAKYGATTNGLYVVAVDVGEYRVINGTSTLIGTTRRDLQLVVATCPVTKTPTLALPVVSGASGSYTVEEGQLLSLPLSARQADGHPLALTLNSVLLDGSGPFDAALDGNQGTMVSGNPTGTTVKTGVGSVGGTFAFTPACGQAREAPYDVAVTVKDNGCAGKTAVAIIRITVTKPGGPTAIAGDATVCGLHTTHGYTASGGTAPGVRWRAVGGTFVGGNTGKTVQITWTSLPGKVVAIGVNSTGCATDSVSKAVTLVATPPLTVSGSQIICQGGSTTIGVSGAGTSYTISGGPASGSGPFVLSPTATTTYTIASSQLTSGCASLAQVTITVNPLPAAAVGAATRGTCAGVPFTLGAAPVAGSTYQWVPATGLSDPTSANPTLTLPNTTGAAISQTYTLAVTNTATGCVGTGSVVVTVNPAAVAVAGPAQTVCDHGTVALGIAALPGYRYQWMPATNLSSATVAQPVLTGVNAGSAPLTQLYRVQATTAAGCVALDSVLVTINPRPVADTIVGPRSVCPTVTGIVYRVQTPRASTYHWTVAGGTLTGGQGTAAITVDWPTAGTGTVSVQTSNALGCSSDVAQVPVIINRVLQTATPTGPASVCQADGPFAYQTVLATGSLYSWQLFGTAQGTLVNTGNRTSITFTKAGPARLVVTETSDPSGGICRGTSDTLVIQVKPSPSAALTIQGPARFCAGSGNQTYSLPGAAGSNYVFVLNGAALAGSGNLVVVPGSTAVGSYTLTAQETSAAGCAGPLYTTTFTVDPLPGALSISGPRFVCPSGLTQTYSVPNASASSTFQWAVAGGSISSGQGTGSITVAFAAGLTGNATVSVTETSQFGCAGAAVALTVVPDNATAPQLYAASVLDDDNTKTLLTFRVVAPNSPNPVRVLRREAGSTGPFVQVGTVAAPTDGSSTSSFQDSGLDAAQTAYEYSLDITTGCGDLLAATLPATTILLKALAVPGPGGRNQGSTSLSWSAYQGLPVTQYVLEQQLDGKGYAPLATLSGSTLQYGVPNTGQGFRQCYRVRAFLNSPTGAPLLAASNTACVDFEEKTAFYNIITPNGDGLNDKLEIDNVQLYPGNTMQVFNRWGREVFSTTNYNNQRNYWGADPSIAPGVYYYLFKTADGTSTKGWVEVAR